jgi:hypothetical protein
VSDVATWTRTLDGNLGLLERMLAGVDRPGSLRPLAEGGSHLNWLVGHLAVSRDAMLRAAAADPLGDERLREGYRMGSDAPGDAAALELGALTELLRRQGQRLAERLPNLDDDALAAPSGMGDADVRRYLEFMVWHETYHLGQAVLYRRALGLDSPIG